MNKAIFLFNFTDIMIKPWLDAGYECWSFDGKHPEGITRDGNHVKVGMWFSADPTGSQARMIAEMVGPGVRFIASFAECTYLTTTGSRWLYHPDDKHLPTSERRPHPLYPDRRKDQQEAIIMAKMVRHVARYCELLWDEDTIPWMLENPAISVLNTRWRKPDYTFDPADYGGYLPEDDVHPLFPDIYPPRDAYRKNTGIWSGGGFVMPLKRPVHSPPGFPAHNRTGGKSARTKEIRSCTPRGFAKAVFIFNDR